MVKDEFDRKAVQPPGPPSPADPEHGTGIQARIARLEEQKRQALEEEKRQRQAEEWRIKLQAVRAPSLGMAGKDAASLTREMHAHVKRWNEQHDRTARDFDRRIDKLKKTEAARTASISETAAELTQRRPRGLAHSSPLVRTFTACAHDLGHER